MKKLFAVMLLSAFTFGTLVVSADPSVKTDTTKKEKSKKDTTTKKPPVAKF
jgi:hypothetical protein